MNKRNTFKIFVIFIFTLPISIPVYLVYFGYVIGIGACKNTLEIIDKDIKDGGK